MQLSKEALKEFEVLWKQDHPEMEIDPNALLDMATRVITVVKIVNENMGKGRYAKS